MQRMDDKAKALSWSRRLRPAQAGLESLPDDILIRLLSHLATRDAQRSCILSRRWRDLWQYIDNLDFSIEPCHITSSCAYYVHWVNLVLKAHASPALNLFGVRFLFRSKHSPDIDYWLQFALGKGVKHLSLHLIPGPDPDEYTISTLQRCHYSNYSFPLFRIVFPSSIAPLKTLSLHSVDISSEQLNTVLSVCNSLETLRVCLSKTLTYLNVVGPNPPGRLKCFHLADNPQLATINISAPTPHLVSFMYRGFATFRLGFAPRLVDVSWDGIMPLDSPMMYTCFANLESLHLPFRGGELPLASEKLCPGAVHLFRTLPMMNHLKHLKLQLEGHHGLSGRSLDELYDMIRRKAPCLRQLTLNADKDEKKHDLLAIWHQLITDHQHLQVLEYIGYRGRESDNQLILRLCHTILSMKKLIIDLENPMLMRSRWASYCIEALKRQLPARISTSPS